MAELVKKVQESFVHSFEYAPQHLIQAPGRVNLIGEHTDYNDGFVLPCAIDYQTVVACAGRNDRTVRLISVDYGNDSDEFSLDEPIEFLADKMWANYIRGVIVCLMQRGYTFNGADIVVSGNVPQGAGLSSSAALEVVIGQAFKVMYQLDISQAEIALNGQQAENQFVGCNCGIMDQLISAKGEEGKALLIDCRSLDTKPVSIPDELTIMIINSNKKRGLVDSEYNTRREQCEEAARVLGIKALRDITLQQLKARLSELDPVVAKRALHVVSENERTVQAGVALNNSDINQLGQLMQQSHISMRDNFEITVAEVDLLVELVKEVIGEQGGVRMTGGGFGGCVVALLPHALVAPVTEKIQSCYQQKTGLKESIYLCHAKQGASELLNAELEEVH